MLKTVSLTLLLGTKSQQLCELLSKSKKNSFGWLKLRNLASNRLRQSCGMVNTLVSKGVLSDATAKAIIEFRDVRIRRYIPRKLVPFLNQSFRARSTVVFVYCFSCEISKSRIGSGSLRPGRETQSRVAILLRGTKHVRLRKLKPAIMSPRRAKYNTLRGDRNDSAGRMVSSNKSGTGKASS